MEKHILSRKNVIAMMLRYMKENLDYMKAVRHISNNGVDIHSYDRYFICYYLATLMGTRSYFMTRKNVNATTVDFYKKILRPIIFMELAESPLFDKSSSYYLGLHMKIKKSSIEEMKDVYINQDSCNIYFTDAILNKLHNTYIPSNYITKLRSMERDFFDIMFK